MPTWNNEVNKKLSVLANGITKGAILSYLQSRPGVGRTKQKARFGMVFSCMFISAGGTGYLFWPPDKLLESW